MADQGKNKRLELSNLIKKAPSRQVENVLVGFTYILIVLLIVFAIIPTFKTINGINEEIKEKERISKALDDKIEALSSLDEEYIENTDAFKDLTLLFPSTGNFSLFLSNIDAVVSRNNFVLKSINFSDYEKEVLSSKASVLEPWSVRMTVSGKKVYLITLLKDLEAMPMYPVVESVSYSSDIDEEGNTSYSLALRIYHIENAKFYE